jgi:hypothetical protein
VLKNDATMKKDGRAKHTWKLNTDLKKSASSSDQLTIPQETLVSTAQEGIFVMTWVKQVSLTK